MTRSFSCASCSAPLEFEGTTMQKCRYCGSTVIAPPEMFYASSATPFGDFSSLTGKALKIAEINQLLHDGNKLEAIKVFRETFGVGLSEAKEAVERMERGESVDISGMQVRTSRAVTEADIEKVKKIGFTIGGSILATVVLSLLIIGGVIVAIFYFTWTAIESKIPITANAANSVVRPSATPSVARDMTELLKIGGEGSGPGRFTDNRHVAVDGQGRIYSSDYSPFRIQVFGADGKFLTQWAAPSGTNLYDLVADREGNLYLASDKGVFKFEGETGKLLASVTNINARGIALTWDKKLVATAGNGLVVFDANLKTLVDIKDAAEKANSTFGFEKLATDGSGAIYAIDRQNDEVCKFSPDGKFLNRFPSHAGSANAIAIDPRGLVFISETSEIKVLDANGVLQRSVDAKQAFGIAFDQAGDLFVASRPYLIKYKLAF